MAYYAKRAFEILREEGAFQLFRSTRSSLSAPLLMYQFRHYINHRRYPIRYTSADPFKIITVDPTNVYTFDSWPTEEEIHDQRIVFDSMGRFHKWENVGYVVNGDWDQEIRYELKRERSFRNHFVDGIPWKETEYFKHRLERIKKGDKWRGCETESELITHFEKWDHIYNNIKKEGYQRSPPESVFLWKNNFDELTVCIGQDGRLIRNSSGGCRLAIARLLDLDSIPARVLIRHKDWESIRRQTDDSPQISEYSNHPDLEDIITK